MPVQKTKGKSHRVTSRFTLGILTSVLLIASINPVLARNEYLTSSQASDGSVLVTLNGVIYFCDPVSLEAFIGPPTFTLESSAVVVHSDIAPGECSPPGYPLPPPQPYAVTINAGKVQDGVYTVSWDFFEFQSGLLFQTFTSSFAQVEGLLPLFSSDFEQDLQ